MSSRTLEGNRSSAGDRFRALDVQDAPLKSGSNHSMYKHAPADSRSQSTDGDGAGSLDGQAASLIPGRTQQSKHASANGQAASITSGSTRQSNHVSADRQSASVTSGSNCQSKHAPADSRTLRHVMNRKGEHEHSKPSRAALVTVRRGDTVTAIHCPVQAARWVDSLLEPARPAVGDSPIMQRLQVVEDSLRLQMSLGASHLQQVEKCPEAYGLPTSARAPVRALRRRRNKALHGIDNHSGQTNSSESTQDSYSVAELMTIAQSKHTKSDSENPAASMDPEPLTSGSNSQSEHASARSRSTSFENRARNLDEQAASLTSGSNRQSKHAPANSRSHSIDGDAAGPLGHVYSSSSHAGNLTVIRDENADGFIQAEETTSLEAGMAFLNSPSFAPKMIVVTSGIDRQSKHEVHKEQEKTPASKHAGLKLDRVKVYAGDAVLYWDKDVKEWLIGAVFHGNTESVRICVAEHPNDTMLATCFDMPQGHTDLWKIMNPTVVRQVIRDSADRSDRRLAALTAAAP